MRKIQIFEMFMRDGLQSLKKVYTLNQKKFFINNLLNANIQNIEFGSTTNPKLLPQMDNSYKLWNHIHQLKVLDVKDELTNNKFTMLVVDKNNLYKCMNEGITSFGLICSLSDSFGQSNMKRDSIRTFVDILNNIDILFSTGKDIHVRVYISCTFGTYNDNDKYDDKNGMFRRNLIAFLRLLMGKSAQYAIRKDQMDIVLCDTYGVLNNKLLEMVLEDVAEIDPGIMEYIALHLHTDGDFHPYIDCALKYGVNKIDSSILNIGGCPYSGKKNISNIDTLNLVKYLHDKDYYTSINYNVLKEMQDEISQIMEK